MQMPPAFHPIAVDTTDSSVHLTMSNFETNIMSFCRVRMNYSSAIDEHNDLVGRFNNLKYDYEILLGEHDNLLLRYNTLTNQ